MLEKAKAQVRYRRALRSQVASRQELPYFSRFGGLWTDRRDAGEQLATRLSEGRISESDAALLRDWIANGYVVLERAVETAACVRLRSELADAFSRGDERLLANTRGSQEFHPLRADQDLDGVRVADAYVYYESARAVLFSEPIVAFLRVLFEDTPLLFQSLTFETGSQQRLHQDTAFVVTNSPLELAASWIALEDIQPGSGELTYIEGSHRLPEYLFSGKYKHWNPKRDGDQQHAEWHGLIHEHADSMGLEQKTFLPKTGDVLIWSADLAHGGSPVTDPSLTRRSIVGHYCPNRVEPFYFNVRADRRGKRSFQGSLYSSLYYALGS